LGTIVSERHLKQLNEIGHGKEKQAIKPVLFLVRHAWQEDRHRIMGLNYSTCKQPFLEFCLDSLKLTGIKALIATVRAFLFVWDRIPLTSQGSYEMIKLSYLELIVVIYNSQILVRHYLVESMFGLGEKLKLIFIMEVIWRMF
jgi:hypothetical protein